MLLGSRSYSTLLRRTLLCRTLCSEPPQNNNISLNELITPDDPSNKKPNGKSLYHALEGIRNSVTNPRLRNDPAFMDWVKRLEGVIGEGSGSSVKAEISGIRDLESLGMGDSFAVKNLENNLIWRCRNMSVEDLLFVLTFTRAKVRNVKLNRGFEESDGSSSPGNEIEMKLYKEAVKCLERRWTEITKPDHIITMILCSNSFSKSANEKVEDRVTDLSGGFLPPDLLNILIAFAKVRCRPLNVLKNLTYHLRKNTEGIDLQLACDGLFALSSLSLFDKKLVQSLADVILNSIDDEVEKQVLSNCLVSLGRLRHFDKRLLEKISKSFSEDLESLDYKTLHSYAMTSALLNYRPKHNESHANILNHILSRYSSYEKCAENTPENKRDIIWLDIVWSLSLLGFRKHHLLESVLAEDFLHKVMYATSGSNVGGLLKILNINAMAQYLEHDYKGPVLALSSFPLLRDVNVSSPSDAFYALCLDIFSNFASPPNHSKTSVNTGMGFSIGAEAVISSKNLKPMDIDKFGMFGRPEGEKYPPQITDDAKRLAMLPVTYFDCNLNGSHGGMMDLRVRLLKSRGFKVLLLHHEEISAIPKKTDKVKFVEKIFKKVMS